MVNNTFPKHPLLTAASLTMLALLLLAGSTSAQLTIGINITEPKKINPGSNEEITVAILTTENFDAPLIVNISSIRLGPANATVKHNLGKKKDVDKDGDYDLLLGFKNHDTGIECGDDLVTLTGKTLDGETIIGSVNIETVGCGHEPKPSPTPTPEPTPKPTHTPRPTATPEPTPTPTLTGTISGYKINDTDGNGRWDVNETGILGWNITLYRINDGNYSEKLTNDTGFFRFDNLPAGIYLLNETPRSGWQHTSPLSRNINLGESENSTNNNFTNKRIVLPPTEGNGSISGYKIEDVNENGRWDPEEVGISGWDITLEGINDGSFRGATTDSFGFYRFDNLSLGSYRVREINRTGWRATNSTVRTITLVNGENSSNNNFTNRKTPTGLLMSLAGSGSGDSGACEAGVVTKENLTNIKMYENRTMYKTGGEILLSKFSTLDKIKEVGFTAKSDTPCARVARAELLFGKPRLATADAPGTIYFNIWIGPSEYGEYSVMENPYVVFTVPGEKDNLNIKLMMLKEGSWVELNTEKVGESIFKAYTKGFGNFAIVKKSEMPVEISISKAATRDVKEGPVSQKPMNWGLIIISLILIAIITLIYRFRK